MVSGEGNRSLAFPINKPNPINWNSKRERRERGRAVVASCINQQRITDFYEILRKTDDLVTELVNSNEEIASEVSILRSQLPVRHNNPADSDGILGRLFKQYQNQQASNRHGVRHKDEAINQFSMTLFLLGGQRCAEILSANLKGIIPSASTLRRRIKLYNNNIHEGNFLTIISGRLILTKIFLGIATLRNLKEFIVCNDLPPIVVLSEDATAIIRNREYHTGTNCIVGTSFPLDERGLPNSQNHQANFLHDIIFQFENYDKATVVFVVMAQLLAEGMPAFRICVFGSNNKFTSSDVEKRSMHLEEALRETGIESLIWSADGDSRELKFMRQRLNLGYLPGCYESLKRPKKKRGKQFKKSNDPRQELRIKWDWFICDVLSSRIPVQDTIHEGAKLRTRFLKSEYLIPIGNFVANREHIVAVMNSPFVGKGETGVLPSDLDLHDKMNYDAVQRLARPELIELLKKHIPDSSGTQFYLKLMYYITSSYLDRKITPLERIYRIWFCVFSFRYWRQWLKSDTAYTLQKNFVSLNSYLCCEINAHAIILVIKFLKEKKKPELFLPWYFGSQACESYFKTARSFTPVESTMVNFSCKDFIYTRSSKIDATIMSVSRGRANGVCYPRHEENLKRYGGRESSTEAFQLPSLDEIEGIVLKARADAENELKSMDMILDGAAKFDFDDCLSSYRQQVVQRAEECTSKADAAHPDLIDDEEEFTNRIDNMAVEENSDEENSNLLSLICKGKFKDYRKSLENASKKNRSSVEFKFETSPFLKLSDGAGNNTIIRKFDIVRHLENDVGKLSSDRNLRVKQNSDDLNKSKKKVRKVHNENLRVGDWGVFKDSKRESNKLFAGHVLAFRRLSKDDRKNKVVEWKKEKDFGVLCMWYQILEENGSIDLKQVDIFAHGFLPCDTYICSMPDPLVSLNDDVVSLSIKLEVMSDIRKLCFN